MDYGIAENPFADGFTREDEPQTKSYSLFDQPSRTSPLVESTTVQDGLQQSPQPPTTSRYEQSENYLPQERQHEQYQSYNPGYQPTESYVGREDSMTGNFTKHSVSPPSDQAEQEQEQEQSGMRRKPVGGGSADDGPNGVSARIRSLEI